MTNETYIATDTPAADAITRNARALVQEIEWFTRIVNHRLDNYFEIPAEEQANTTDEKETIKGNVLDEIISAASVNGLPENPPVLGNNSSVYADFINYYRLNANERMVLMLALIPHIQPQLLDVFFTVNKKMGRGFTEFGGIKGTRHGGFIPTIETALFLMAGNDLGKRFRMHRMFEPDHIFISHNIIQLDTSGAAEPSFSSTIILTDEYVDFFTTGNYRKPVFSTQFPAKQVTTLMNWDDLVVDEYTAQQLDEIRIWMKHGQRLFTEWNMGNNLKYGYKALFHGPPGTGKTLTAALLGKQFGIDVYRVDLSMVISKYIGETEQNLEKVFKKAENKNWILFFDEADALFGKRTSISDAHDKYANQEIAYLLQRLEEYRGLVILASNMRSNVDEAFTRRLQSIIHFPKPQPKERFRLWSNAFSRECIAPDAEEIDRIAQQYELSGGSIVNVVQYASLMTLNRNDTEVSVEDLLNGIRKEFNKEGKTI